MSEARVFEGTGSCERIGLSGVNRSWITLSRCTQIAGERLDPNSRNSQNLDRRPAGVRAMS
jgi:hypothetical protein